MDGNLLLLIGGAAMILVAVFAAIAVIIKFMRTGAKKYSADYGGEKDSYKGAKDKYRAGSRVKLYYDLVAADTDYEFFVDGKRINTDYDREKGFIISFTMPEHDVKIEHTAKNSMTEEESEA